ncbi:hypothetical protein PLESTM_001500700 [Pleodorina starrii]|nr:hypothetical protein PLESTM_001500700 [Pleodorina starrii]
MAELESAVESTQAMSLGDPFPEVADNLCDLLVFDEESLLRLGRVNKCWRRIVNTPALWDRLNAERFGLVANTPATVPAQPATAIPGWCFFPGLDSDGGDCANPDDAGGQLNPLDLAARAEQLNAVAFNTQGWIKRDIKPYRAWNRYSYTPGVGMYVREEVVARRLGRPLPPALPEVAEPEARPPDFPGWVFYPLMDSPGCDIRHPENGGGDFLASCTTLSELAEVASRLPNCVAFNTLGYLKHNLHPLVHWRQMGGACSWNGMYVREDEAAARRLWRPVPGRIMDPCIRFCQLAKTRLMAARDVDVTWLNGKYLERVPDPYTARMAAAGELADLAGTAADGGAAAAAPANPGALPLPLLLPPAEAVRLIDVCWLELSGRFNGVGPGRYRCVWLLHSIRNCNIPELNFRITLRDARRLRDGLAAAAGADAPGSSAAAGGSGSDGIPALGSELAALVVDRKELRSRSGNGWCRQRAGAFEVPRGAVYDVDVRLWNHGPTWKSGLMFKELRLERLEEGEAAEEGQAAGAVVEEEGEEEEEDDDPSSVWDEGDAYSDGILDNWEGDGDYDDYEDDDD